MQQSLTPHQLLKKYYGYDQFRPHQLEIIETILSGRDTLVLMPTGGGKSVCYQLPALLSSGITLVVSPLLALMKDQVDALLANGISAAVLNSMQSEAESREVWQQLQTGAVKLLYLSPERLLSDTATYLQQLPISLIAIDEAHCVSQWGHDFRPEYSKLSTLKQLFPRTPVIALTATADKLTREDIVQQLALSNPALFISSFDRPNLSLSVASGYSKQQKMAAISSFLDRHTSQSGIVYCMSRKATEELAVSLQELGYQAAAYHAGLPTAQRERCQNDFLNDRIEIMCATIAFGMGIDKSNVRWVIHYNMPKSIECYYQEIGRAGRDGMASDTLLFYTLGDMVMLSKFADESGQREVNLEKLRRMQQYAESPVCRRRILLSYFGESVEHDCGNCDVCNNPPQRFDGTILVQKALSAVARTNEEIGINLLIDILRGSHRHEVLSRGYDRLPTFGVGADLNFVQWQGYLLQMLQLGYIELQYNKGNQIAIRELGWRVLRGTLSCQLTEVAKEAPSRQAKAKGAKGATRTVVTRNSDELLFDSLRMLRKQLAEKEGVPAYLIFTDKVLQELVEHKPTTLQEVSEISGIGVAKLAKYGKLLVNHIRKELGKKRSTGESYEDTLVLLNQGLTIEEIALYRHLKEITIYSHLAHLIQHGRVSQWQQFVSAEEVQEVTQAWLQNGRPNELKPLYVALEGAISYGKIRIALAIMAGKDNSEE